MLSGITLRIHEYVKLYFELRHPIWLSGNPLLSLVATTGALWDYAGCF